MKTYHSKLALWLLIVGGTFCLSSCLMHGGSFFSGNYITNECSFTVNRFTGDTIKWEKDQLPVTFYVHHSVPVEAHKNFVAATNYWNMVWGDYLEERGLPESTLFEVLESQWQDFDGPKNDTYNTLFFLEDFNRYGKPSMQAVTVASSEGSFMKDTDILVNASQFKFYYDDEYNHNINLAFQKRNSFRNISSSFQPSWHERVKNKIFSFFKFIFNWLIGVESKSRTLATYDAPVPSGFVDFPSLMIHELGHVPGLGHVEKEEKITDYHSMRQASLGKNHNEKPERGLVSNHSVMHPKLPPGFSRRRISDFDLNNLFCGYYR